MYKPFGMFCPKIHGQVHLAFGFGPQSQQQSQPTASQPTVQRNGDSGSKETRDGCQQEIIYFDKNTPLYFPSTEEKADFAAAATTDGIAPP
uniref:Uncharacterized protein n=1 Tax=Ditylenchus dipsaci TaxID=166011 RepID=A0A915DX69_9BILA